LVGAARFELTTPCPPDRCANRAALRPDRNGADYRDAPIAAQQRSTNGFSGCASELTGCARLLDVITLERFHFETRPWPKLSQHDLTRISVSIRRPQTARRRARRPRPDLTDILYQRDRETIAFVRPDLAVSGTGSWPVAQVAGIRAPSAV